MKWKNSLVFRIGVAINILVLTGVLTISAVYLWRETIHLEKKLTDEAITAANTLNSAIGLYMLEGKYEKISPLTYSLQSEPNIAYVIVRDPEGTTINQKGDMYTKPENLIPVKVPLEYFRVQLGEVEIGLKTTSLNQQKKALVSDTIITALIYSLLSLFISFLISNKLTSPIKKLVDATRKIANGDRNVKVIEEVDIWEIEELANEFNKMALTIQNHENILVNEINKATKELSEKVEILEVLGSISNSVLEDDIQSYDVIKNMLISIKHYILVDHISFSFQHYNNQVRIIKIDENEMIVTFHLKEADYPFDFASHQKQLFIRNDLQVNKGRSYFEQMLYKESFLSLLILPIVAKNNVIGTLNLASDQQDFFSEEIIQKLSVFTNQIALALDRVSAYESLQKSAYHDYLTGLPNYRLFKIRAEEVLQKAKMNQSLSSFMFLDLDRFKMVNDTFGHETGDLLLKYISKRIVSCLTDQDTVARIGGDEFMILIPTINNRKEAIAIAKRILKTLENPIIMKGYKVPISASIGLAFYPIDGMDVDNLIKHADRAMLRVKKQGKNNYAIYSKCKDNGLENQIILENELRKATKHHEFVVYYQPKINIQNGTIAGVEALVRWLHPEKGLIFPGDFIPLAEETGLIIPIGEMVLRRCL